MIESTVGWWNEGSALVGALVGRMNKPQWFVRSFVRSFENVNQFRASEGGAKRCSALLSALLEAMSAKPMAR